MSRAIKVLVSEEFYPRLVNRDKYQGDGLHTAEEFRAKFLAELDSKEAWEDEETSIIFDFKELRKIGPSFANEAFAYFMKYTTPDRFLKKVKFLNADEVDMDIIENELEAGYSR